MLITTDSERIPRQILYWLGSELDDWKSADADDRMHLSIDFLSPLGELALPSMFGPLQLPATYLPADRTGTTRLHNVVVGALIDGAPMAGPYPTARTPTLTGVLTDFLQQLIEIGRSRSPHQTYRPDFGGDIEKDILGGKVLVDSSTHFDYPRFTYVPHGWMDDLALSNASSIVSELAPLVLHLRHWIKPDNVLIIEEPEAHLHPAMQVAFTRQLASLVTAGIRVIVTTHSEWSLEELSNIVRRSKLSRAEIGDDVALHPDCVGVWLFEPKLRTNGSIVKEISFDNSGLYPSEFLMKPPKPCITNGLTSQVGLRWPLDRIVGKGPRHARPEIPRKAWIEAG